MGASKKEISETIDSIFTHGNYFYSDYIFKQLKKTRSISLIGGILEKSTKTISEAVIVILAAIRFIQNDLDAFSKLEETGSFDEFLNNNYDQILQICINKKVQSNIPERAFPVLEILGKDFPDKKIGVIELGASFGLIGRCLLNPELILENKKEYLYPNQMIPKNPGKINSYLGIEIDPPDKNWLLACFSVKEDALRVENYIEKIRLNNFKLIKASALGFSELQETLQFIQEDIVPVVLTSFMLYQFSNDFQKMLSDEIFNFVKKNGGHWIKQEVDLSKGIEGLNYYIDMDGEKIMDLQDDKCSKWGWCKQ